MFPTLSLLLALSATATTVLAADCAPGSNTQSDAIIADAKTLASTVCATDGACGLISASPDDPIFAANSTASGWNSTISSGTNSTLSSNGTMSSNGTTPQVGPSGCWRQLNNVVLEARCSDVGVSCDVSVSCSAAYDDIINQCFANGAQSGGSGVYNYAGVTYTLLVQ